MPAGLESFPASALYRHLVSSSRFIGLGQKNKKNKNPENLLLDVPSPGRHEDTESENSTFLWAPSCPAAVTPLIEIKLDKNGAALLREMAFPEPRTF